MDIKLKIAKDKLPLISIITVVLNSGEVLEQTILSVIEQSYQNIEYLIIDGGSTDTTQEIINKYSDKIDYYISEPDNGIYDAMNKGIAAAKGDWVYFLGAGDILYNKLHDLAPQFTDPMTIYYGDVYHNDIQRIYDGKFPAYKLAVNNICHQAVFYPSKALQKYKFNTRYKIFADHALNMQCYGDKEIKFKYVPVLVCNYQGGGISAVKPDREFFEDKMSIIRENFSFPVFLYAFFRRFLAKLIKKPTY
jgi:glycosyltransferase involved in cell wall biosynthesis